MKVSSVIVIALCGVFTACAHGVKKWQQTIQDNVSVSARDLKVDAAKMPYTDIDSSSLNFRVRISFMQAQQGNTDAEKMMYRSDSSFYIMSSNRKFYPYMNQSIAAGVKGRYEYLIGFDAAQLQPLQHLTLVYDRHIQGANIYKLVLK